MTRDDVFWLAFIVIVGIAALVAVCVRRLGGVPRHLARQVLLAISAFLLHGSIGITILIYLRPVLSGGPAAAYGAVTALYGWFGLGAHLLFRLIPSVEGRPKPRWMLRLGIFDLACLLAIAGGMTIAAGSD